MSNEQYGKLLDRLQHLLEIFELIAVIILGIELVLLKPRQFNNNRAGYVIFMAALQKIIIGFVIFAGDFKIICTIGITIITLGLLWFIKFFLSVYYFIIVSGKVLFTLFLYTYILSLFMIWLPGFNNYLSNFNSKSWYNPILRNKKE